MEIVSASIVGELVPAAVVGKLVGCSLDGVKLKFAEWGQQVHSGSSDSVNVELNNNWWFLYSAILLQKKTWCARAHLSCTLYTCRCTIYAWRKVCVGVWKVLSEQEGLQLAFEFKQWERFRRLAGSKFQTNRVMKLKECWPKDFRFRWGILKSKIVYKVHVFVSLLY